MIKGMPYITISNDYIFMDGFGWWPLDDNIDLSRCIHPYTTYEDAVENGEFIQYYLDGSKMVKGYYKNREFDGTWTVWFRNGQKCWEGFYHEGIQVGKWVEWNENGNVIIEIYYKDGKIDIVRTHEVDS